MSGGLLVVTAHPDDEVLVAGGLLAACSAAGAATAVLCLTRGENGPIAAAAGASTETLGEVRVRELEAACETLGVGWVRCLDFRDGWLEWDDADKPRAAVADAIAELRPDAVVTFGEEGLYWHPDHIVVNRLARELLAEGGGGADLYESAWPRSAMVDLTAALRERALPSDLWDIDPAAFGVDEEEGLIEVDVSRFLAQKLRALRAHVTQVGPGHAFTEIPADLAVQFLGVERFRAVRPGAGEWLLETAAAGVAADG
jgi:N-acetyl-1-D-myo-inositol-2-amino-2-deoxy-alpha-D-glucopyranoside deacetylase